MKRICIVIISILLLFFTAGCARKSSGDRYRLSSVASETVFEVDTVIRQGGFYGEDFFYLDNNTGEVHSLSLSDGEDRLLADGISLLSVDETGICVLPAEADAIRMLSHDGAETGSFPLEGLHPNGGKFTGMDAHDGIIVLTDGTNLWTVSQSNGKITPIPLSGGLYKEIVRPQVTDRNHILFVGSQGNDSQANTLYECSPSGKITGSWSGSTYTSYCRCGEDIYCMSSLKLCRQNDQGTVEIAELDPHSPSGKGLASVVAVSGDTAAVCWYGRPAVVALVPLTQPEGLRILTASSDLNKIRDLNTITGSAVVPIELTDAAFHDKLVTKLLAGDDDFDLVYVTGQIDEVGSLFRSISENGRFVDLNGNPDLKAHLGEMYPGVRDLISADGKIVCLPLDFAFTLYGFSGGDGLSCPDFHLTADDLWDLCGALQSEAAGRCVFSNQYPKRVSRILLDMVGSMLLDKTARGEDLSAAAEEEIAAFLRDVRPRIEQGVLFGENPVLSHTVMGSFPFGSIAALTEPAYDLLAPPTVRAGERYSIGLAGFVFVNPTSPHTEEALALLSKITDEENRYDLNLLFAPLFPGLDRYHYDERLSDRAITTIPEDKKDWFAVLESVLPQYYANAVIGDLNITSRAWDAMADFCAGKTTPEETARVLYEEIVYAMKG